MPRDDLCPLNRILVWRTRTDKKQGERWISENLRHITHSFQNLPRKGSEVGPPNGWFSKPDWRVENILTMSGARSWLRDESNKELIGGRSQWELHAGLGKAFMSPWRGSVLGVKHRWPCGVLARLLSLQTLRPEDFASFLFSFVFSLTLKRLDRLPKRRFISLETG